MNDALKMVADKVKSNPALKAQLAEELKTAVANEQDAAKKESIVNAAKNILDIDIAVDAAAQPKPQQMADAGAAVPGGSISSILAMLLGK